MDCQSRSADCCGPLHEPGKSSEKPARIVPIGSPGIDETTAVFDTLRLARTLREKAKLSPEQAEGIADAIAEAVQADIATKGDLREVKFELEAKIEASKAEIVRWLFGTIGFQTIVIIDAVVASSKAAGH